MLVGPTGSGKTLFLEAIAGLHNLSKGKIQVDGKDITQLEPEKRNIGIVYQDCALFPHLSVAENIVFGLKVRNIARNIIKNTFIELVTLVGISHLIDRSTKTLSGGEKQKIALARALATKPSLLLLDEPLSALDPETREGLQAELKRIHSEKNITIIHVTHDFDEAMSLGRHIAVMGDGQIRQYGTPEEIFYKPNSEFVARFTGMKNILPGEVVKQTNNSSVFRVDGIDLVTSSLKGKTRFACIRPDDVRLSFTDHGGLNTYSGVISKVEDKGMTVQLIVDLPPRIDCLITHRDYNDMRLNPGKQVFISFTPDSVHLF